MKKFVYFALTTVFFLDFIRGQIKRELLEKRTLTIANISKFSKWPSVKNHRNFKLCILGEKNLFESAKRLLANQQINHKEIDVEYVNSLEKIGSCHTLYIDFPNSKAVHNLRELSSRHHILTIGESENFTLLGGCVQFKVGFLKSKLQINLNSIKSSGVRVSSELIQLAQN